MHVHSQLPERKYIQFQMITYHQNLVTCSLQGFRTSLLTCLVPSSVLTRLQWQLYTAEFSHSIPLLLKQLSLVHFRIDDRRPAMCRLCACLATVTLFISALYPVLCRTCGITTRGRLLSSLLLSSHTCFHTCFHTCLCPYWTSAHKWEMDFKVQHRASASVYVLSDR